MINQSDARALRTVLSLTGVKDGLRGHIVVELGDLDNEVLVKLVGGDLVETVVAHDVIGRLMIQCARQPGLAQVTSSSFLYVIRSNRFTILITMFMRKVEKTRFNVKWADSGWVTWVTAGVGRHSRL